MMTLNKKIIAGSAAAIAIIGGTVFADTIGGPSNPTSTPSSTPIAADSTPSPSASPSSTPIASNTPALKPAKLPPVTQEDVQAVATPIPTASPAPTVISVDWCYVESAVSSPVKTNPNQYATYRILHMSDGSTQPGDTTVTISEPPNTVECANNTAPY